MRSLPPVDALPLIRETDRGLIELLQALEEADWRRAAVGSWTVRDVAAHLLDGNLRRLSLGRDRMRPPAPDTPPGDFESTVSFLNQLNAEWTRAAKRLSPRVVLDLLKLSNVQVSDYFAELDPEGPAPFPVDWAGETPTPAWLDVAREYTEKWHHQQQIRDATGRHGLKDAHFLEPLLSTLIRALPRAYQSVAMEGTVHIDIVDLPRCDWLLSRGDGAVLLYLHEAGVRPDADIRIPSEPAWRFLMKNMPPEEARTYAEVSGTSELIEPFFNARGVMA